MLPEWLSIKPASTEKYAAIKQTMSSVGLNTVCTEAHCPNAAECWSSGTATFMILGNTCTRGCRFCAIKKSSAGATIDAREPEKLAKIIQEWKLKYAVLTSVCRDDLEDQGAGHFADCIREIKKASPGTIVELLIPDFGGGVSCLQQIVDARPDVIGHNLETVERLSPSVRDGRASYSQSLNVLKTCKTLNERIYTKSALMLGMGESEAEVLAAFSDLRNAGVDFLAIGQYLRPSSKQMAVSEYIVPERFEHLKEKALEAGFLYVAAGPFVRSSYNAAKYFAMAKNK